MPRKSTDNLEPQPTPTRRSSRLSIAPSSRTEEESATKRTSRKKKSESDDVLTPIEETFDRLEHVTPKRKNKKPEDLLQDDDEDDQHSEAQSTTTANATTTTETIESVIPSTPEAATNKIFASPISSTPMLPQKLDTPKKVATPVKVVSPVKTPVKTTTTTATVLPATAPTATPDTYSSSSEGDEAQDKDLLQDGGEIVAIWAQCRRALGFGWSAICPVFAATIFVLTLFGVCTASQFVAIVGIVYVLFFGLVLSSYALCMLPFILLSRLFTQIVCSNNTLGDGSTRFINLCCRLLLFVTIFGLAAVLVVAAAQQP